MLIIAFVILFQVNDFGVSLFQVMEVPAHELHGFHVLDRTSMSVSPHAGEYLTCQ